MPPADSSLPLNLQGLYLLCKRDWFTPLRGLSSPSQAVCELESQEVSGVAQAQAAGPSTRGQWCNCQGQRTQSADIKGQEKGVSPRGESGCVWALHR